MLIKNNLFREKDNSQIPTSFFTNEYYLLLSKIKDNRAICHDTSYFSKSDSSFREKKGNSIYECLALEIVPEVSCQLNCDFCFIDKTRKHLKSKPIDFSTVARIIDQCSEIDDFGKKPLFGQIAFIGGEPTLNADLPEMVKYSIAKRLNPIIITNGIKFADIDYARKICLNGCIIVVHLPFLGPNADLTLDNIVGRKGYSSILFKTVDNLLKIRTELENAGGFLKIIGDLVLNSVSIKYALNIHEFCRKNKIHPFFERMRLSDNRENNKNLIPSSKEIRQLLLNIFQFDLENYSETILVNGIHKDFAKVQYLIPPTFNNPCTMAQTGIHIKYGENGFGDALSCCGQTVVHGNISRESLKTIINNKIESKLFIEQSKYIGGPCSECEFYELAGCKGGCRGNANHTFRCSRASDPNCIFIREEFKTNPKLMRPANCIDCPIRDCRKCEQTK